MEEELYHYGMPHRSGRFEWGSGENPYQHPYRERNDFLAKNDELKKIYGSNDSKIAKAMGLTVDAYRQRRTIAAAEEKAALVKRAQRLQKKLGKNASYTKIGEIMGYNDTTIRNWLLSADNPKKNAKTKIDNTSNFLEEKLKSTPSGILDVGIGSEIALGVTDTTFKAALKSLEDKGYVVGTLEVKQPLDPSKNTTVKYLAKKGTTLKDAFDNRENMGTVMEFSPNQGVDFVKAQRPASMDSKKIKVVYADETFNGVKNSGNEHDGMIAIRRGSKDITLGNSEYAQVRILVDGTHYIKGMAIYSDEVPAGKDVIVYSNKKSGTPLLGETGETSVLKPCKSDPDNPFGANIMAGGQSYYKDSKGKYVETDTKDVFELDESFKKSGQRYSLSPVNKLKEEDAWEDYRKQAAAQFLSKQPIKLIKQQLDVTYNNAADQYKEIMSNTNPVVRQRMLNEFAEKIDKSARKLEAAPLPGQTNKVIFAVPSLSNTEVYAPTYPDGTKLALIRYPHQGTFEIPILTVNNKNTEGKGLLKNARDAIGINKYNADILSGADFDGDSVLTIPVTDKVNIKRREPLDGLKGFNAREEYKGYEGMPIISKRYAGIQMGIVTNLITDMSVQNATDEEMTRAVKYAQTIIDAHKHELNWKLAAEENGIDALQRKYQKKPDVEEGSRKKSYGGSSTLLSKLGNATVKVEELQLVNPKTGKRTYTADPETGEYHYAKSGKMLKYLVKDPKTKKPILDEQGNKQYVLKPALMEVSPLDLVKDAHELSSGTLQEEAYANHINKMRSLANQARKEALAIKTPPRDPSAAKTYAEEVASLNEKLKKAQSNKPLERQAVMKTGARIDKMLKNDPTLKDDKDKWNKTKQRLIKEARNEVGAGKQMIQITPNEWKAIQAKAVSGTFLSKLLDNADMDIVYTYSNPDKGNKLTTQKISYIKSLDKAGFTIAEIAEQAGVSTSTVSNYLKG